VDETRSELIDVVVEIPARTRNKYEFDEVTGRLRLERQLPTSLVYPADYGFVPETLAEDGDPLDALVLLDEPAVPGCVVRVQTLGVLWVADEHGPDPKLITTLPEVAERSHWNDIEDLTRRTLEELEHFFSVYKDLETNRSVETNGYSGRVKAMEVIEDAKRRFFEKSNS
jgi:inorganic pyrophosphatase